MTTADNKIEKSVKMMRHIMTDAGEGLGIAYWAKVRKVQHDQNGIVTSFEVGDAGPDGDPVKKGWRVISPRSIMKARDMIVNGDVNLNRDTKAQFIGQPWDWEYDADGVDALIQIAFFGEIIYG